MQLPSRIVELIRELRRRRVLQAAAVYATGAFVAVQVAANVFPALQLPPWTQSLVVVAAIAGFPIVVVVWWQYEVTPEGIRRTVDEDAPAEIVHARGTPWVALLMVGVVTAASAGIGWVAWDLWLEPGRASVSPAVDDSSSEPTPLPTDRVAVLPFADGSPEGSLEHLARGFSGDLTHQLDAIAALQVISERGTMPFADYDLPLDSVARRLGAGSLVTGSVEAVGDSIRLRVQLVDGRSAANLMSRDFTAPRDSVLALRADLAEAAVQELRRHLGREIELTRERRGTDRREAWELYHAAERRVERGDSLRYAGASELAERQYERADSLYRAAGREDSDWAEPSVARGWLAHKRARLAGFAFNQTDPDWLRTASSRASEILEGDPGNAAALELRGVVRSFLAQVPGVDSVEALRGRALDDLRAAVTGDPDRARAWAELAEILRAQGRLDEARAAWDEARGADAFLSNDGDVLRLGAHLFLELGYPERALEWAAMGRRRYPNLPVFPQLELLILPMERAPRVPPDTVWRIYREFGEWPAARILVAAALARTGYPDSARSVLESALRSLPENQEIYAAYYEPMVWLNLGDTARAVRLLTEAVETYDAYSRSYVASDAWWEPLKGNRAFEALVGGG